MEVEIEDACSTSTTPRACGADVSETSHLTNVSLIPNNWDRCSQTTLEEESFNFFGCQEDDDENDSHHQTKSISNRPRLREVAAYPLTTVRDLARKMTELDRWLGPFMLAESVGDEYRKAMDELHTLCNELTTSLTNGRGTLSGYRGIYVVILSIFWIFVKKRLTSF